MYELDTHKVHHDMEYGVTITKVSIRFLFSDLLLMIIRRSSRLERILSLLLLNRKHTDFSVSWTLGCSTICIHYVDCGILDTQTVYPIQLNLCFRYQCYAVRATPHGTPQESV